MKNLIFVTAILASLTFAQAATAEERTVKLEIDNFYCASCAYIIQKTLAGLPGVANSKVTVVLCVNSILPLL
jgi:hypothetical protein